MVVMRKLRSNKFLEEDILKHIGLKQRLENRFTFHSNPMWQEIIQITWPAFIELVMSTLFGMVDMMMVGRLSPAAIAAVGLTNQPVRLLMAIFAAVNIGTTTLVLNL